MAEPTKKQQEKKQQDQLRNFMSTKLDFSPFTLDVGDGVSWGFSPDPSPAETSRLSKAMEAISEASGGGAEELEVAYAAILDAIKARIIDEKQRKEFPKPEYGTQALMWFGLHLATGRDGLPTE